MRRTKKNPCNNCKQTISCVECKQAINESKLYCGRLKEYVDELVDIVAVPCSLFEKEPEAYRLYRRT